MTTNILALTDALGNLVRFRHKGRPGRKLLKAAGIKLFFLPPYSPDVNPIEKVHLWNL